ncbi:hypothetical protein MIMGU_mgv1a009864mg [Erythranthe guttata]|uniref:Glycosyltransferases n=1 Tax=Erythranthe guttata TaxID=4155 RepID=A0A022REA1_ERYGU|nr:PREDICTED: probable beta-1,4-xylosyltransferase IRX9 [Erythranthe guttata]EYU38516.1 hypothetical protein MIMGU_mgv1a009864mg [Erythranthe guttata]|eukprot:XP_012835995.1 PREDICTED: probable beta-1,4-xylosyltransferase IRX9 [Erythranthe guttata]
MGSQERSKKNFHLWKKAILHFLICFVMGFFTGFAPISKPTGFSSHITVSPSTSYSPQLIELDVTGPTAGHNHSTETAVIEEEEEQEEEEKRDQREDSNQTKLLILITPISTRNKIRNALVTRLANTLKLVAKPLLWIVVEQQFDDDFEVSEILRKTGIMYRHVVSKGNFTDVDSETDHHRNLALIHIEQHRLSGIVHFVGLSNVYDLSFFDEIRTIETFGTWPVAKVYANKEEVRIEGPVCDSSEVVGWHLKRMRNMTETRPPLIHISSFAFNSSILWDPERWGRTSSLQDASQNSVKFVRDEVVEEETSLKGIPAQGCSKVLLWVSEG